MGGKSNSSKLYVMADDNGAGMTCFINSDFKYVPNILCLNSWLWSLCVFHRQKSFPKLLKKSKRPREEISCFLPGNGSKSPLLPLLLAVTGVEKLALTRTICHFEDGCLQQVGASLRLFLVYFPTLSITSQSWPPRAGAADGHGVISASAMLASGFRL